ncbi:MAG: YlxR family protein [Gloeomargarita sp. SKYBB_i_bin120]|nr:YlxR family protein [Gloeomargarita sp. SKYBB_i_bin120]
MPPGWRRCLSCRTVGPREQFWRVVRLHPSHQVVLDQGMGRSAYLCPKRECLQYAQQKNRLGKALKAPVPPEIYAALWARLNTAGPAPDNRPPDAQSGPQCPESGGRA